MSEIQSKTVFVFGCGYLGIRVARQLVSDSWKVFALTRSQRRARVLQDEGVEPMVGDWTDRRVLNGLPSTERVLIAVGYDASSGQSRHQVYVDGLRNAVDAIHPRSDVVYVSSTGVFHQTGGIWVDETSPCRPDREGGKSHLEAEDLLFRKRGGSEQGKTVVLRMAGLYGPGRIPRVESIKRGEPVSTDPDAYLNLIHIDDAASTVLAAWQHPSPERRYLIADGHPVVRRDYFEQIREIVGGPTVRYSSNGETGKSGSRSDSNKRIWNARMRRDLLARPAFPSYREGLRSVLVGE